MNFLLSIVVTLVLFTPGILFAQINQSLINLPVDPQAGPEGFSNYINLLYALSISVAGLLAVIKIIIAGVKYMLTDVVTSKGDAIREIKGALLGLLLILAAVLILTVINPQLIKSTLTFNPQPRAQVNVTPSVRSNPPTPAPTAPPTTPTNPTTPTPAPTTPTNPTTPTAPSSCSPTITTSVQGIYTKFSQNLTGCTSADKTTYRQAITDQCRGYGTNATGDGTVSSCLVLTSKL